MKVGYIISEQNITVNYNGETHIISRDNKVAPKIIECLKSKDYSNLEALVDASKQISKYSNERFRVVNGEIWFDDWKAPEALSEKILNFMTEDLPYEPLVRFAEKVRSNPSYRVVNSLYAFLSHNGMPLTEDGNIIAYKRIRSDFKDIYSGNFDNSVGSTVSVVRNQVDEDPDKTCSYGLHVAAWDYAKNHYGNSSADVFVEVEVDPSDIVAIPRDYNEQKCRCCKYVVRSVVNNPLEENLLVRNERLASEDDCECCDDCENCDDCEDYSDEAEGCDEDNSNNSNCNCCACTDQERCYTDLCRNDEATGDGCNGCYQCSSTSHVSVPEARCPGDCNGCAGEYCHEYNYYYPSAKYNVASEKDVEDLSECLEEEPASEYKILW